MFGQTHTKTKRGHKPDSIQVHEAAPMLCLLPGSLHPYFLHIETHTHGTMQVKATTRHYEVTDWARPEKR